MTTELNFCYIKIKKHSKIRMPFESFMEINSSFRRSLNRHNLQHRGRLQNH